MNHLTKVCVGLLAVAISLIDIASPLIQVIVTSFALVIGFLGAGMVYRARNDVQKFLFGFEFLLFIVATLLALGALVDIGLHWGK